MPNWPANWLERHQHPLSLGLHLIGIPAAVAAVVLALMPFWTSRPGPWWLPAGLLIAGYLLQWLGHRIEGNDMGEVILIKKWLGRPFTAVSPQYSSPPDKPETDNTDEGTRPG